MVKPFKNFGAAKSSALTNWLDSEASIVISPPFTTPSLAIEKGSDPVD